MKVTAVSPAHVTGFFKIYSKGSTGAGVNLENGMITTVQLKRERKSKIEVFINKKKSTALTSESVAKKYLEIVQKKITVKKNVQGYSLKIMHSTPYPIGYGLGISGAGALSLSIALNRALLLGLSKKEVLEIAKKAEIENGTGLGDVVAEQFSGAMMGLLPYPSKKIAKIPCRFRYVVLGFFAPLSTKKIITSKKWKNKINKAGKVCMKEMHRKKSFLNFVFLSRYFTKETGLVSPKLRKALEFFPFGSMAMLGQTIFIPTHDPKRIEGELRKFTKETMIAKVAKCGAKVI
jgi:pantoate kinase